VLLARTGVGRDINRHYYSRAEVEAELRTPVVAALLELIRLRNAHPAFGGTFELGDTPADQLLLRWRQGPHHAQLDANFTAGSWCLRASATDGNGAEYVCTDSSVLQR